MREPNRIQRKRSRGWRAPDGAVYVGRPTRWGNPHRVDLRGITGEDRASATTVAVEMYRADLLAGRLPVTVDDVRRELRGRDLMCWCRLDHECHADVLLEVANSPQSKTPAGR